MQINTTYTGIICAALTAAVLIPVLTATDAEARGRGRGGGDSFVEKDFIVPKGARGYTGFVPGGAYCDYIRRPNRKCYITRSGREKCRIVNWTLTQTCYQ